MTFETLLLFCLGGIALCVLAVFALETVVALLFCEKRAESIPPGPAESRAEHLISVDFPAEPTMPRAA